MNSCCENLFSDSLTFHIDLLTELGKHWQTIITNEIENCDKLAKAMKTLVRSLKLAEGASMDGVGKCTAVQSASEQLYYQIDVPFRSWLASIDPNWESGSDEEERSIETWRNTAKSIAGKLGYDLVKQSGSAAIVGRMGKDEKDKDRYYCAANAYRYFLYQLSEIYPKEE